MIKLICQDCRHENEPERIYCRECGARLDRTSLAKRKSTQEDPKDAHKRVRKMFDPNRAWLRVMFFKVSKLILGALVAAVVIQVVLPPDVPPPMKTAMLASQITIDLENATMYRRPPQLQYSEEQVNAYLAYIQKNKQTALNKPLLKFERLIAHFGENFCEITAQRSVNGNSILSIYTTTNYSVSVENGKIVATNRGGRMGRLPVHSELMKYGDILFADVWKALDRERKLFAKLGNVEFHDKTVVLTAPGVAAAPPPAAAPAPEQTPAPAAESPLPTATPAGTP